MRTRGRGPTLTLSVALVALAALLQLQTRTFAAAAPPKRVAVGAPPGRPNLGGPTDAESLATGRSRPMADLLEHPVQAAVDEAPSAPKQKRRRRGVPLVTPTKVPRYAQLKTAPEHMAQSLNFVWRNQAEIAAKPRLRRWSKATAAEYRQLPSESHVAVRSYASKFSRTPARAADWHRFMRQLARSPREQWDAMTYAKMREQGDDEYKYAKQNLYRGRMTIAAHYDTLRHMQDTGMVPPPSPTQQGPAQGRGAGARRKRARPSAAPALEPESGRESKTMPSGALSPVKTRSSQRRRAAPSASVDLPSPEHPNSAVAGGASSRHTPTPTPSDSSDSAWAASSASLQSPSSSGGSSSSSSSSAPRARPSRPARLLVYNKRPGLRSDAAVESVAAARPRRSLRLLSTSSSSSSSSSPSSPSSLSSSPPPPSSSPGPLLAVPEKHLTDVVHQAPGGNGAVPVANPRFKRPPPAVEAATFRKANAAAEQNERNFEALVHQSFQREQQQGHAAASLPAPSLASRRGFSSSPLHIVGGHANPFVASHAPSPNSPLGHGPMLSTAEESPSHPYMSRSGTTPSPPPSPGGLASWGSFEHILP